MADLAILHTSLKSNVNSLPDCHLSDPDNAGILKINLKMAYNRDADLITESKLF